MTNLPRQIKEWIAAGHNRSAWVSCIDINRIIIKDNLTLYTERGDTLEQAARAVIERSKNE